MMVLDQEAEGQLISPMGLSILQFASLSFAAFLKRKPMSVGRFARSCTKGSEGIKLLAPIDTGDKRV